MGDAPVRVAVLGCGAVVEQCHLPAARAVSGLTISVLVDRDLARAQRLAARYGIAEASDTFDGLSGRVDAVLIALPNRLHAPVAIDCLSRGIAVLVEKPMATTPTDAEAMHDAATACGTVLQVALMKRFSRGAQFIKQALEAGTIGRVTGFSIDWGVDFNWPLTSNSGMTRGEAGGGVLVDFGSHLLDLLCWWLGEPDAVAYRDDARGGIEADCELSLTMQGPLGRVPGTARFGRIRTLRNTVRIVGEQLTIEWQHEAPDAIRVFPTTWSDAPPALVWQGADSPQTFADLFVAQWQAFTHAVRGQCPCPVTATDVLPGMRLMAHCYDTRRALTQPWEVPVMLPGEVVAP